MIRVKRLNPDAKLPCRSNPRAAGYDLYSCERVIIPVGGTVVVPLGIAVEFPPGHAALLWDRSGMGAKGIHAFGWDLYDEALGIHRFAGVIDSDYRGAWGVVLHNASGSPYKIEPGDRVAQALFQEVKDWPVEETLELSDTARGEGGFGSTGR